MRQQVSSRWDMKIKILNDRGRCTCYGARDMAGNYFCEYNRRMECLCRHFEFSRGDLSGHCRVLDVSRESRGLIIRFRVCRDITGGFGDRCVCALIENIYDDVIIRKNDRAIC